MRVGGIPCPLSLFSRRGMKTFLLLITILTAGGAEQALLVPSTPELNSQTGCETMGQAIQQKLAEKKVVVLASCVGIDTADIMKIQVPSTD